MGFPMIHLHHKNHLVNPLTTWDDPQSTKPHQVGFFKDLNFVEGVGTKLTNIFGKSLAAGRAVFSTFFGMDFLWPFSKVY